MKCCCSLLFKQRKLKRIPSFTLDLKGDLGIHVYCFWLRIRPFLNYVLVLYCSDVSARSAMRHPVQQIQKCPITSTYCIHAHLIKTR